MSPRHDKKQRKRKVKDRNFYKRHQPRLREEARLRMKRLRAQRKLDKWREAPLDHDNTEDEAVQSNPDRDLIESETTQASVGVFTEFVTAGQSFITRWGDVLKLSRFLRRGAEAARSSGQFYQWLTDIQAEIERMVVLTDQATQFGPPLEGDIWPSYSATLISLIRLTTVLEVHLDELEERELNRAKNI
ncbi:hypothetical protein BDN72DRAFT_864638 [Pluteus cervinus]|uniref:Uncharacterized protein n=1 Tax=Pluteus cervinus TaxID=181527 RepID=A0ACD3A2J7_9AGAR|nr:hypothetical protein BDN72DRAFT_864638 [Pluteus cervinus]